MGQSEVAKSLHGSVTNFEAKNTSVALDELEKQSILQPLKLFFFPHSLKVRGKEKN